MKPESRRTAEAAPTRFLDRVLVRVPLQIAATVAAGAVLGMVLQHSRFNTAEGVEVVLQLFSCLALAIVVIFAMVNLVKEIRRHRK